MKIFNCLFGPKLAENIPGVKRVYRNFWGNIVKIIEVSERTIPNLTHENASDFVLNMNKAGIYGTQSKFGSKLSRITTTGEPINISSIVVRDSNGLITRANAIIRSKNAVLKYKSRCNNFINDGFSGTTYSYEKIK